MKKNIFLLFIIFYNMQVHGMINKLKLRRARTYNHTRSLTPTRLRSSTEMVVHRDRQMLLFIKKDAQDRVKSNENIAKELSQWSPVAHSIYTRQMLFYKDYLEGNAIAQKWGLDPNFTYGKHGNTLLIDSVDCLLLRSSAGQSYKNKIIALLQLGADINRGNLNGRNPVMKAIEIYDKQLIKLFFKNEKLNVHHKDNDNNTLLHSCVKVMLANSAFQKNANNRDYDFMIAKIKQLVERGLNPKIKNKHEKTALECALQESGKELPHLHYPNTPSGRYKNTIPQEIIDFLRDIENKHDSSIGKN